MRRLGSAGHTRREVLGTLVSVLVGLNSGARAQQNVGDDPGALAARLVDAGGYKAVPGDPWRGLEDLNDPVVKAFVAQHGAEARRLLDTPARAAFAARLQELVDVDFPLTPVPRGDVTFQRRLMPGRNQPVLFVSEKGAEPRVLVDPNTWGGNMVMGAISPSPDGRWLAYTESRAGADDATLRIMDVRTGTLSEVDVFPNALFMQPQWTPNGASFIYAHTPAVGAPGDAAAAGKRMALRDVRRHEMGTSPAVDVVLRGPTRDEAVMEEPWLSEDGRHLLVLRRRGAGVTADDVFHKRLDARGDFAQLFAGRKGGHRPIGANGDVLFFQTTEGAPFGRILAVDVSTSPTAVDEVVGERQYRTLEQARVVGDRIILHYLEDAKSRLEVRDLKGGVQGDLALPDPNGVVINLSSEPTPANRSLYAVFHSLTTPPTILRYDVRTGEGTTIQRMDVTPKVPLTSEQLFIVDRHGNRIPVFVLRAQHLVEPAPVLMTGYGAFGVSNTPDFVQHAVVFAERGGIYVSVCLPGGGEYGEEWHSKGKGANRHQVYDAFVDVARALVKQGRTRPGMITATGGSAGGLLVAAAALQAPDAFGGIVPMMAVTDMERGLTTGLGALWKDEFGANPYSPYREALAVKETTLPKWLVMAAQEDDRVLPWHSYKLFAALAGKADVHLDHLDDAAHGAGTKDTFVRMFADLLAFAARVGAQ
jgi:prolyl oligopeptidase